jgi:hypothetical protein
MAEWSNAAVLKTVVPLREPGVRIPLSPQLGCVFVCLCGCEEGYIPENIKKPAFFCWLFCFVNSLTINQV